MEKKKIMIVEDELVIAMDIRNTLINYGYNVDAIASSGTEAIKVAEKLKPDLILMDIHISGEYDGIQTAGILRKDTAIPVVYLTALTSESTFKRAQDTKPYGYLVKPVGHNDLFTAIETAFNRFELEERLKESEECYQTIFDQAADPILLIDPETGYITQCNSMAKKYFNFKSDPLQFTIFDIGLKETDKKIKKTIMNLSTGESTLVETGRFSDSGENQDITINARNIVIHGKNFIQGIFRDITQKKKADEDLRISEERFSLALESTGIGLWEENFMTREIYFNPHFYTMLGYIPYEFDPVYSNWLPLLHPDDHDVVINKYKEYYRGQSDNYEVELRMKAKNGNWKWFLARGRIISRDNRGKAERVIGTNVDITEKKNFEMKLSVSEKRLDFAIRGAKLGWFDINIPEDKILINPRVREISGYNVEFFNSYNFILENIIHPEDRKIFIEERDKSRSGVNPDFSCEHRIITKEGKIKWLLSASMIVERSKDGTPLRSAGTICDITERKSLEIARKEIHKKYRILIENVSDIIWIFKIDSRELFFISPSVAGVSGYTPEELICKPLEKWITRTSIEEAMTLLQKELEIDSYSDSERTSIIDLAIICRNNDIKLVESTLKFLRDDSGRPVSVLGISRDITERKNQELLIKESEDKFSKAFHLNPSMMAIAKFDSGELIDVNESFLDTTGYCRESIIGEKIYNTKYYNEEDQVSALKTIIKNNARCKNILINLKNSSGDIRICEFSVESVELKGEHCLLFVIMDITERIKIEQALTKSEEKYRLLAENVTDPIWIIDLETMKISYISPSVRKITGTNPDKIVGSHLSSWLQPEDYKYTFDFLNRELKKTNKKKPHKRKSVTLEIKVVAFNGTVLDTEQTMNFLRDAEDKPVSILGVYRNITERKKADQQIKESLREKEILLKEIHHRVKNNFQIITSLLNLQESKIQDETVLAHFKDYENRIRAMALIHEKLYQSDDLSRINFGEYINLMTRELYQTYSCDPEKIILDIRVEDVMLQINQALPCGMILNELLTNSLKYAFPDSISQNNSIRVILNKNLGQINLKVEDNGIGLPEDLDISNTESLGLKLIYMSAKNQLKGMVSIDRKNGTSITVSFPVL